MQGTGAARQQTPKTNVASPYNTAEDGSGSLAIGDRMENFFKKRLRTDFCLQQY